MNTELGDIAVGDPSGRAWENIIEQRVRRELAELQDECQDLGEGLGLVE